MLQTTNAYETTKSLYIAGVSVSVGPVSCQVDLRNFDSAGETQISTLTRVTLLDRASVLDIILFCIRSIRMPDRSYTLTAGLSVTGIA